MRAGRDIERVDAETLTRRELIGRGAALAAVALGLPGLLRAAATPMVVYKDPNCGCCHNWVEIMRKRGFEVSVRDTDDMMAIKNRYKVGSALASCHTALVAGYVIEGHVPPDLIRKLLAAKPKVLGLAVPGMPAKGSRWWQAKSRRSPTRPARQRMKSPKKSKACRTSRRKW